MKKILQWVPFERPNRWLMKYFGERAREILYAILLAVYMITVAAAFANTELDISLVDNEILWTVITLLLFVYIYLLSDYKLWQLCAIVCVVSVTGLSLYCSGDSCLFFLFLYVFAARSIPYKKICKLIAVVTVSCIVIITLGCFIGYTSDLVIIRSEEVGQGRIRHALGFANANNIGLFILTAFMSAYPLIKKNMKKWYYLSMAVIIAVVFYLTDSKNFLLCMLLIVLVMGLRPFVEKLGCKGQIILYSAIFFIGCTAVFCMIYWYSKDILPIRLINIAFSDRFNIGHWAIKQFGIGLFGTNAVISYPLDSVFAYLPVRFGLPSAVIFAAATYISTVRCIKKGRTELLLLSLIILFYGISEQFVLYACFNVLMFTLTAKLDENNCYPVKPI